MHTPRPRTLALFVMGLAAAIFGFVGVAGTPSAQATPAQNLNVQNQSCLASGHVLVTFSWTPSGQGTQFFDITQLNNNFATQWGNSGPLGPNVSSFQWTLDPNVTFYTRVNTWTGFAWSPTPTMAFTTINCAGPFSPPTNPTSQVLSATSVQVSWDRGTNNHFFCVDFAKSQPDLQNLTNTWFNTHCGTTGTTVQVGGLDCGTTYYWRTWAAGPGTAGYTPIANFTTADCAFVPPDNLQTREPQANSVSVGWDLNTPAFWSCVDYAKNQSDLENITGTWSNECTTGTSVELTGLDCGTRYFWRVFAYGGPNANGYSEMARFQTASC